jgi:lysophospholipase L1-like esterase
MNDDVRICFFGDSLVNGTGDRQALGWTGRVCAVANHSKFVVTHYNLGIRRNTSQDVLARWQVEFEERNMSSADCRMVFSFGINDTVMENNHCRVSEDLSLENAHLIMKQAAELAPVLWVSPTPVDDDEHNRRTEILSRNYNEVADKFDIKYINVFDALINNSVWLKEVKNGDGSHPDGAGYAVLSELILSGSDWW